MKDLIVILDSKKSQMQSRIVLRFFEGKIKILKSGILSSVFLNADFNKKYENFTDKELSEIKNLLENSMTIELKQKYYSIETEDFAKISSDFENGKIFFFAKNPKSHRFAYFPIQKIQFVKSERFSIEKNNGILIIQYIKEKTSFSGQNQNELQIVKPKAEIFILTESKAPLCSLKFQYGDISIDFFDETEIFQDSKNRFLRNKGEENNLIALLSLFGFVRKGDKFQYKGNESFLRVAEKLLEAGVALFDSKANSVKSSKSFSINVNYGTDWFDVSLLHEGTFLSSFVYDNINLNSKFFDFNGEKFLLPEVLEENKETLKIRDGKLLIEKEDYLTALEIESEICKNSLANFENLFKNESKIVLSDNQKKKLRPYQVDGVNFLEKLKSNGFGALLADDMGLGKTLQAITFLSQTERKSSAFIVVPKSLLENWRNEFAKFAPDLSVLIYHGTSRKENQDFEKYDIVLSTYATVMIDIDFLSKNKFSVVVFDEVQTIKNYKSKMYESSFKLHADFKMALSGTPFENNVLELWSVMRLLNPKIFAKRTFFMSAVQKKQFARIKTAISPFILQRKKSDVLKDLPEKYEEIIFCTMDDDMASCYAGLHSKIKEQIRSEAEKTQIVFSAFILQSLLKLRQFCCHPNLLPKGTLPINLDSSAKFEVLKIKIQSLIIQKEKIIVFSQFTSMLKIIKDWLEGEKIKTFYLDGETDNRQNLVDEFEKSDDGVFLISLKAGGVGLNLVSCHYMFIYDPWWNPASENQAADRIYRIGQKNNVFVYRLITKNTIEEKVLELKGIKSEIAASIFGNLQTEKISTEALMQILE